MKDNPYKWNPEDYSVELQIVTLAMAQDWLAQNIFNRRVTDSYVGRLKESVEKGRWRFNGASAIVFGENGQLLDGQHRLRSIIATGVGLLCVVVRGIKADAFHTIDIGKKRSFQDIISIPGDIENPRVLSPAIGYFAAYLKSSSFIVAICREDERIAVLKDHPRLRSYAKIYHPKSSFRVPPGLLTACHYLFSLKDNSQADEFMTQIIDGVNLQKTDPAYRYREWVDRNMVKRNIGTINKAGQTLIKAWNYFRGGEQLDSPIRTPSIPPEIQ